MIIFFKTFKWFFYPEFYDKYNPKMQILESGASALILEDFKNKFKDGTFLLSDTMEPEITKKIVIINGEINRLKKVKKNFEFEFKYSYYTSIFCEIISMIMLIFICKTYIGMETILSLCLLTIFIISMPFVYRYWVIQTSKYYEQLI